MQLSQLKIGTRLYIGFGILLLFVLAVSGIAWHSLAKTKQNIEVIIDENNVKITSADQMRLQLNIIARSVRNIILYETPDLVKVQKERIAQATDIYSENNARLQKLLVTDTGRKIWEDIEASRNAAMPPLAKAIELAEAGSQKEAIVQLREVAQGPQDIWFEALQKMIDLQEKQNHDSIESLNAEYSQSISLLTAAALLSAALSILLAWAVTRSIVRPIHSAVGVTQSVADSDLTSEVVVIGNDEAAELLEAIQKMQASLGSVVASVRSSAESVATASTEIAQGNQDLSQRTEEQASALEQTAASMEQLSATVKQNAESALEANQLAQRASVVAAEGGRVVGQVIHTMKNINDSSRKISDIINVIDGIAFQTNILALNAAVEAARAGEQGRGFAVVASEVRSLAGRSAQAAKEIKTLISESVECVDEGSALVEQAGVTMDNVVASIRTVTDLMVEISAASTEQSAGVEQIGEAIVQMDQVTQQNAALVEEMAAAAGSLQLQAADLVHSVAVFKTTTHAQPRAVGMAPQRPAAPKPPTPRPPAARPHGKVASPIHRAQGKLSPPRAAAAATAAAGNNAHGPDAWSTF